MAHSQEVVITTKNTASLSLGLMSMTIGVLALLFGWVPFLGLFVIPVALIGGALAALGFLIALFKGFRGAGMPILGGIICVVALVLPVLSTGGTSVAISESMAQVEQQIEAQRAAIQMEAELAREQEDAVKEEYISQNLELYEVVAKYMDSFLDGRVPGVLFKVRNRGERSLDMVEVTFFFKDANGDILAEEDFLPVFVSDYSFSGDSKPLKPGYVWQMEKGKFYTAKSVPNEWHEGSVEAVITDIRFTDQE